MLHLRRLAAAAALCFAAATLAANAQTTPAQTPPAMAQPSAAPSAMPIPTPTNPPEDPGVTARVTKEFLAWQGAKIDRTGYSPNAGGTYINALIALVAPDLQAIGKPQTTTYQTASMLLGDLVYRYQITGDTGAISVLCAIEPGGKIDDITFTPQIFRAP